MTFEPLVDARLARALRSGAGRALIFECDHPAHFQRLWSHVGTLRWKGYDYLGIGALGKVSGVTQTQSVGLKQVSFELSGLPRDGVDLLSDRVRGRLATVYLAALNPNGRLACEPSVLLESRLDYQTMRTEDNGLVTIKLIGWVGFWNTERAPNIAWSHETQIVKYPNDTGLAQLPSMAEKESNWRNT